jgi:hypothetical protein
MNDFKYDENTKVLINTNNEAYQLYRQLRDSKKQNSLFEARLSKLEQQVQQLREIVNGSSSK